MGTYRRNISVDEKTWHEARKILKEELNMTISKYVDIQLRALVRSQTHTARELYEGVTQDLFEDLEYSKRKRKRNK